MKRMAQLRVLSHERTDLVQRVTHALKNALKLSRGSRFCLRERHLHATVRVDFSISRRFDGEKTEVWESLYQRCLYAVGLH